MNAVLKAAKQENAKRIQFRSRKEMVCAILRVFVGMQLAVIEYARNVAGIH